MAATTYNAVLEVSKLRLSVHLGCYPEERKQPQDINIDIRFYLSRPQECFSDDDAPDFICYDKLCQMLIAFVAGKEFRLIEFMGSEMLKLIRQNFSELGGRTALTNGEDVAIWLSLHKCSLPTPYQTNGAKFTCTDLPVGAQILPAA